jgi:hypothetical protein
MALQNLQQYGCQTRNKLKEKSRDLNRNSSTSPSGIQLIISASPNVEITSPGRRALDAQAKEIKNKFIRYCLFFL